MPDCSAAFTKRAARLVARSAAALALTLTSGACAAAQSAGATPTDTTTARMMSRIGALSADSMEGRRAGTPGSQRARRWIIAELTAMGAKPAGSSFEQFVKLPARAGSDTAGANIVVRIPGRNSNGPVLVASAHYDHLGVREGVVFNGADDDASGCVALLTIAERLLRQPPQHDVILAFLDAEESGMHGANTFVNSPPVPIARIAFNLNLDMVSRQDNNALWVAGTSHYPFLKAPAEAVAKSAAIPVKFGHDTKDLKPGDDWTGSSDHRAFHAKGIPFLYLGVEDHADYHKAGDDANKIDPQFYRSVVDFAYRLLRAVDERVESFPARKP
ncbi:MAG TPA: M20/M25/M40 family metallo-hydrolase [Gemmatimonas sp.]|nr:M20/M25/M40 family metallo-hydrolase [Gemmatimonas sp.]